MLIVVIIIDCLMVFRYSMDPSFPSEPLLRVLFKKDVRFSTIFSIKIHLTAFEYPVSLIYFRFEIEISLGWKYHDLEMGCGCHYRLYLEFGIWKRYTRVGFSLCVLGNEGENYWKEMPQAIFTIISLPWGLTGNAKNFFQILYSWVWDWATQ